MIIVYIQPNNKLTSFEIIRLHSSGGKNWEGIGSGGKKCERLISQRQVAKANHQRRSVLNRKFIITCIFEISNTDYLTMSVGLLTKNLSHL